MSGTTGVTLGSLTAANSAATGVGLVVRIPSLADPTKFVFGVVAPSALGGGGASYTLPAATTSVRGGIRPDGTTITINGDVISAVGGGTSTPLAGITIDGSTIPATTSAPYQMQTADRVVDVNKTAGTATKILLPTSPTLWVEYTIIDGKRDAATNNITITAANGTTINGAVSVVIQSNMGAISMRAVNATTWRLT